MTHIRALVAVIAFMAIISIALGIGTLLLVSDVRSNTERLDRQDHAQAAALARAREQEQDLKDSIIANRRADFRLCTRQMVDRAVMNNDLRHDEQTLPLYDCAPNLVGESPKRLTPAQAAAYRRHVATTPEGQLP